MGNTYDLRLTGPVLSGGNMSIEQYKGTNLEYSGSDKALPNTISPTPAPPFTSTTSRVDRVVNPVISDGTSGTAIFWIKGPLGISANEAFANNLDPNKLVELELKLKWDDLPPGEKIIITDVHGENGNTVSPVNYDAVGWETMGTGAMDNPLELLIFIDPYDIQQASAFHFVKIVVDFDSMIIPEPATPEPATWTLMMIGLAGAVMARRRRSRMRLGGRRS